MWGAFICAEVRIRSDESYHAMGKTAQACANAEDGLQAGGQADVEFIEKTALPDCRTYTMALVQIERKAPA